MSTNAKLNHIHQDHSDGDQNQSTKTKNGFEFDHARVHYNPAHAPSYIDEQEATLILPSSQSNPIEVKRPLWFRVAQTIGVFGTVIWMVTCTAYYMMTDSITSNTPYEFGLFVAGMMAPIVFYWMLLSYLQRNSDVKYYAQNLRSELHTLFFPSEEDSQNVNKDIERMTHQAAELAASSKAVLKSIHRTRYGLRQEIKQFSKFAGKAESHLIGLTNNLVERTNDINHLIDNVDSRIEDIAQKSQNSIQSWDDASARMLERAGDIEGTMDKGAQRILDMAHHASSKSQEISGMFEGTVSSLGISVDAFVEKLSSMSDEFGGHTRTISISTDELSQETSRMGTMIDNHVNQLQGAIGRSVESLTDSLVLVSDNGDRFAEKIDNVIARTSTTQSALQNTVDILSETTKDILVRAEATNETISSNSAEISGAVHRLEGHLETMDAVSTLAQNRISETATVVLNNAVQIENSAKRGVDLIEEASREASCSAQMMVDEIREQILQFKDIEDDSAGIATSLAKTLEQSRDRMNECITVSQSHIKSLDDVVSMQGEKLNGMSQTVIEQVENMTKLFAEPTTSLQNAIQEADDRHTKMHDVLDTRVKSLCEVSDKALSSVDIIRTSLREQANDISELSGRVTAQARTLNTELADNKTNLTETIDATLFDMNRLMNDMDIKVTSIHHASTQTVNDLSEVNKTLDQSVSVLDNALTVTKDSVSLADKEIANFTDDFEGRFNKACTLIHKNHQDIISSCEKITPLYQDIEGGTARSLQRLDDLQQGYQNMSELGLIAMDKASARFDERLLQLQTESQKATESLREISEDVRQNLEGVSLASTQATEKMHGLSAAMQGQSSNIHIMTDQAMIKIESIQSKMDHQVQDISETVGAVICQIEEVGEKFDGHFDKITSQSSDIIDRFTLAGDEAQAKAYELKKASHHLVSVSEDTVDKIAHQMQSLHDNTDRSLSHLTETANNLSIMSKSIDEQMQTVLGQSESYVTKIGGQVTKIADQSGKTTDSIDNAVAKLVGTMDVVKDRTASVVSYISDKNNSLYEQSGRFVTAVTKSAQAAEHATDMFSRQADHLLKASHVAVEKCQDIEKTELRVSRDTFMNSARFVLESLHSLSLDLVRIVEGQVDDKDWKSYQKGDVSIFTAKLVNKLDQVPADKIRVKYAEDSEFRNYVQKFMRQFEDILVQSDHVDRGAILGATFTGSDIGKIYRYLSHVTGRDTKTA